MAKKFSVPRGTADSLPPDYISWRTLEDQARELFHSYGYQEIRTPFFEEKELFARSMGQTSEVVNKQLLELAGDKRQGYALRPEGTAGVVRSYIENSLSKKETISKLFYIGPMFRGERPQKGRLRQFNQIGVEVLGPGTANPYIDAEVIALSVHYLKGLGWEAPELLLNTLGSSKDKEAFAKWLKEALKPHLSKLGKEDQDRYERNVFRVLDSKNKDTEAIISKLNIGHDHLSKDSLEYYTQVKEALDNLGVQYKEVPTLVRGLDYYTHTVFEIVDSSLGSQDALGAGGRYNNLVKELGGEDVDAVGFALGMERILLALHDSKISEFAPLHAYIVALDESTFDKAFVLLSKLRQEYVRCDICYKQGSMKSMMRQADKSGARYVILIGEDEVKKKFVTLKLMKTGSQQTISIDDIDQLASILKKEEED